MENDTELFLHTDWEKLSDDLNPDNPSEYSLKEEQPFDAIALSAGRQPRTLAPNLTRRSHKKSRAGCYTCKNRKIKCGEQKPECQNCLLKGLSCVYPCEKVNRRSNLPLVKRLPTSSSTGAFSMTDLRFFHHFLIIAYPHLPLGNEQVWTREVPQFAEQNEYLMHALLSLGASHLSRLNGVDYRKEALVHRGHAISGLNQALSQRAQSYGKSDAMLAACYALTFQASYMGGDGISDHITMVRGCALTSAKIREENIPTAFNLQPSRHLEVMAPRLRSLPCVDSSLLIDGIRALGALQPCISDQVNLNFLNTLLDVITSLQMSPAAGYMKFGGIYAAWYQLSNDSFKDFLDPNNEIAQLLLAYFIAIEMLMIPLSVYEWPDRARSAKPHTLSGIIEWAEGIFNKLGQSEYVRYLEWPKHIMSIVVAEITGKSFTGSSVLQLNLSISQDTTPSPETCSPQLGEYEFLPE